MIKESTIQKVRELAIEDVVGQYVDIKKNKALSPFTEEKTPSFSIHPAKNIYKCFSSGKGGDGINFIMELKNLTFLEAVEELAKSHGIAVEYQENNFTAEQKAAAQQERERKESISALLNWALAIFCSNNVPKRWQAHRKFSNQTLEKFKIGYASTAKDDLYQAALKAKLSLPNLLEAGLIREHEGKYYDTFQDRVIFPIYDKTGRLVAFTGRLAHDLTEQQKEAAKAEGKYLPPKYYNSPDTLWEKGKNLYGLHLAAKAIQKANMVYLVEGNTDVMRLHEQGIYNVVAPCGTALTSDQIALIRRYTDHVCIVPDGDKAGIKAMQRSAELFIKAQMTVSILEPVDGKDPDDLLKNKTKEETAAYLADLKNYLAEYCLCIAMAKGEESPKAKADAIKELGNLLDLIEDDIERKAYYDAIKADWKPFADYKLKKKVEELQLPKDFDRDRAKEHFNFGFVEENNAYYYVEREQKKTICLFKMEYLYFVETDDIPVYVVRFTNTFGKSAIKALTADQLTLLSEFKKTVGRFRGRFIFEGNEHYLNKINVKLRGGVRAAKEPLNMGYYPQRNFWIWANGIWDQGKLHKPDQFGVVKMRYPLNSIESFLNLPGESVIEINRKDHLIESPQRTLDKMGRDNLQQLIDNELVYTLEYFYLPYAGKLGLKLNDNDYSDQQRFKYVENNELHFERWSKLMREVYHHNGVIMQAYFIMSVFRDVVYDGNNYYNPLLNMFGPPQQGKSTAARSLCRMFGARHGEEEGSNLNTDTSSGIMEYINKFKNSIIWINELSRNLKKEREVKIEMLKTLAGGSGRKTRQTRSYAANKEKNHSGAIISGQDSPSFDPGLHDRVIPLKFDGQHRNPEKFDELKKLENKGYGTQVTAELLQYRKLIESYYPDFAKRSKKKLLNSLKEMVLAGELETMPDDRIVLNMVSLAAPVEILMQYTELSFAFSIEEFYALALHNIKYKSQIKATTNEVAQFFSVLAGAELREGEHWKLQKEKDGKVKLFLRLRQIMPLYRQAASRQQMSPFGEGDIKDMLLMHRAAQNEETANPKYSLGLRSGNVDFPDANIRNTSAIVLDYEMLRSEGIEFRSNKGYVEDFEIADDESFAKTLEDLTKPKKHLNGHAKEAVFAFLRLPDLATGQALELNELLELFNHDKEPPLSKEVFMGYCMEFMQIEKTKEVRFEKGALYIK